MTYSDILFKATALMWALLLALAVFALGSPLAYADEAEDSLPASQAGEPALPPLPDGEEAEGVAETPEPPAEGSASSVEGPAGALDTPQPSSDAPIAPAPDGFEGAPVAEPASEPAGEPAPESAVSTPSVDLAAAPEAEPLEAPTKEAVASEAVPEANGPAPAIPQPRDAQAAVLATAAVEAMPASSATAATPASAVKAAPAAPAAAATAAKSATATAAKAAPAKVAKKAKAAFKAGWYTFKASLNKALALTVIGSNSRAGTKLRLQKISYATGQAFRVIKAGSYYRIYAGTGFKSHVVMNGTNVALGQSKGRDSLFRLVENPNGTYQFVNLATGKALALTKGKAANKAAISGKAYKKGAKAQSFSLAARKGILREGIYAFRTGLSGKRAIAPKAASAASGAKMALSSYSGALSQKWQVKAVPGKQNVYTLESLATGYRLTAVKGKAATQKAPTDASSQWWKVVGAHGQVILQNVKTGQVLQTNKSKGAQNTAVICTAKSTSRRDSQRWSFAKVTPVSTGFYELDVAASRNLALEIAGGSSQNGVKARLATASGDNNQLWYYDAVEKTLTCVASGKLLDIYDASTDSGASVIQWGPNGGDNQRWAFAYVGGGNFKLTSNLGNALALSVPAAQAGAEATSSTYAGAATQQWHLTQPSGDSTANVALSFTLDQMARWQKTGNPYYAGYTLTYLKSVLNPANGSKYKFVDLRKGTGVSAAALNAYIATVGSKGKLAGQGAAFVSACKAHGLNEVYLLAHAILESDWGRSELAGGYKYKGGYIDGVYYKKGTYYNFFGIGAYDDSPLSGGRKAAIINGWSSPAKAITGAAQWIASNYVYRGAYAQPTLYAMKWDYAYSQANNTRGWHQYATSLTWADSIGRLMGECYSKAGSKPTLSYITPVYR